MFVSYETVQKQLVSIFNRQVNNCTRLYCNILDISIWLGHYAHESFRMKCKTLRHILNMKCFLNALNHNFFPRFINLVCMQSLNQCLQVINYTIKTMIYVSDSRYAAIIIMHHISCLPISSHIRVLNLFASSLKI